MTQTVPQRENDHLFTVSTRALKAKEVKQIEQGKWKVVMMVAINIKDAPSLTDQWVYQAGSDKFGRELIRTNADFRESKPRLTLSIGNCLNHKNPFETRFTLTNESPFSLHNVTYMCGAGDAKGGGTALVSFNASTIHELPATKSRTLYCDFSDTPDTILQSVLHADTLMLHITVSSDEHEAIREAADFEFFAKRNVDGEYVWSPAGGGGNQC